MGIGKIARRTFLGLGVAAVGGIAVGYYYHRKPWDNPLDDDLEPGDVVFNPYVKIASSGEITIIAPRAEMGQGVYTTLAAMVAEELDVSLAEVRVEHGKPGPAYYNDAMMRMGGPFPFFDESLMAETMRGVMGGLSRALGLQITGGSSSTVDGYDKMRIAGAVARDMLVRAAAGRWNVDVGVLKTDAGVVTGPGDLRATYGDLAADAAKLDPPSAPELRDPSQWKLLGQSQPRVDLLEKVTGAPIYGIDVELPDMLHATVKISPHFGVGAKSFDETETLKIPGVLKVVPIDASTGKGFGIIAENTWAAFSGAEALEVEWEPASYPKDDDSLLAMYRTALDAEPTFTQGGTGDAADAFANASPDAILEAEYAVPYLAHATMEPMNGTARVLDGRLEIWVGTQGPGLDAQIAGRHVGIDTENVTIHVTHLGGGFGRRMADSAIYAAIVAQHTNGRPVKVTWTREEDMRHDFYRPRALAKMRAVLDKNGPVAFATHVASSSPVKSILSRTFPDMSPPGDDDALLDGQFNQPIAYAHSLYAAHVVDVDIPVGFWRSVGNSFNGYFHESFLDEIAHKQGVDPFDMRIGLMQSEEHRPARLVLEKLREVSGWGRAVPEGKGRGLAFVLSFGTWVGQVVDVDATGDEIKVEKVWCVADPGMVMDPGIFRDQMMSGIVFGISAAFGQEITFENGAVVQGNFDEFDAVRMAQCPEIEVHLQENARRMGGAGEPGTPPVIPALGNAIFAATGQRLRTMPFSQAVSFNGY